MFGIAIVLLALGCDQRRSDLDESDADDTEVPAWPCDGTSGAFSDQTIVVDDEERHYFLFVPSNYDCSRAWPLLVDFHGTAATTDPEVAVEEFYALDGLVDAAESAGVIAVRPRSRSSEEAGQLVYRWDQNPGDIDRNEAFALALVSEITSGYHIGPVWSAGFSNGTNMAFQLADEPEVGVTAIGVVGGGLWNEPGNTGSVARIWATTGHRDYMIWYHRDMEAWLDEQEFAEEGYLWRESDAGHDLYGWHYTEMLDWMAGGKKPVDPPLGEGWSAEELGTQESVTELAVAPNGEVIATGTEGSAWIRAGNGEWSETHSADGLGLLGVCVGLQGEGLAVGDQRVLATEDGGHTWTDIGAVPDYSGYWGGGGGFTLGVGCGSDGSQVVGGYWTAARTEHLGETWSLATMESWGYPATSAALAEVDGIWVAVGYAYVGRSDDGSSFDDREFPWSVTEWLNGVAVSPEGDFWAVGEEGVVVRSDDEGRTWDVFGSAGSEDLYSVSVSPGGKVLVVGAHGSAWIWAGSDWEDVSTGQNGYLGGAVWLDDDTALVAGEGGVVLRR